MSRISLIAALPIALSLLTGCSQEPPLFSGEGTVLAEIDEIKIHSQTLNSYLKMRGYSDAKAPSQAEREAALSELVNLTLLAKHAKELGVEAAADNRIRLELLTAETLADLALTKSLELNPVTEAELRNSYQQREKELAIIQHHARMIVVEKKDAAIDLIGQLLRGANFALLAKQHSTDSTAEQNGDLGWFELRHLPPQFSTAIKTLKTGQFTDQPIQSERGWHILRLEGKRQLPPPSFKELRPQLESLLRARRIEGIIDGLRDKHQLRLNALPIAKLATANSTAGSTATDSAGEEVDEAATN